MLAQSSTPTPAPVDDTITIALFERFELELFDPGVAVANPYDPRQADIVAVFSSPTGKQAMIPAFWMQPYECQDTCAAERLRPTEGAGWRVRFTPGEPGEWTYIVQRRNADTMQTLRLGKFTVRLSDRPGFIRVGQNRRYFAYDSGLTYFPVGINLGWSWDGANNTPGYLAWLSQLRDVGANYARLYIDVPWFIGLEWRGRAGDYSQAQIDAWRLDTILNTAEAYGIALQLVLLWGQGYSVYQGSPVLVPSSPARPNTEADWNSNPLNDVNGGPVDTALQYFSSDAGRELARRRLRYIVARWGYSTSVFAWEIIDQLDRAVSVDVATTWLRDTVGYLREIDPYEHLITAGVRDPAREALLEPVVLDFKEGRYYHRRPIEDTPDQISGLIGVLNPLLAAQDRPVLLTEFSLNPWFEPSADDPTGVHVRQTMWMTAFTGAGGSAMPYWWDTYLFPASLHTVAGPLAAFTRGIPFASTELAPVDLTFASSNTLSLEPYKIEGFGGTFGAPPGPDIVYRLTPDGMVPPIAQQSGYIYGLVYNAQLSRPQRYVITPPVDTTLTVNVLRGSEQASARLAILIDGQTAGEITISPGTRNVSLTVPIKAGERQVVIDNLGDDFLQLDSIEIGAYILPLRTMALADRKTGLLLAALQHRQYTWQNVAQNLAIPVINATIGVTGMPSGEYLIEQWDPFTGNVVGQETITLAANGDGMLTISLLPINSLLAVKAIRIAEQGNLPPVTPIPTSTPRIPVTPTPTSTPMPSVVG
jgi:hypothetical protein